MSHSSPPMPPDRSALAWSFSRHRLLAGCERAVFWTYFGARGLGLPDGDPDARRAFALKNLTALPLLIGTVVHNAARELVAAIQEGRRLPDFESLFNSARLTLNHVWRSSQPDLIDRFWRWPGAYTALQEIVYRGTLRPDEINDARALLATCLINLCKAPLLDDLRAAEPYHILPGFTAPELFTVDAGHAVWVVLDLAYLHADPARCDGLLEDPSWCVVEFKTARRFREEDEPLQLAAYALWLRSRGFPPTGGCYLGRIVDLAHGADRWYVLGEQEMNTTRAVIASDTARQHALLLDPERGLPKPKADWSLAADRRPCPRCRFLALCRNELGLLGQRVSDRERG